MAAVVPLQTSLNLLDGPAQEVMSSTPSQLIRQKADWWELTGFDRRNKYKVANTPDAWNKNGEWSDELFTNEPTTMVIQEESECCERNFFRGKVACGFCLLTLDREMTLHVTKGDNKWKANGGDFENLFSMYRPRTCTTNCLCFELNPPVITTNNLAGAPIGSVSHHFDCMKQLMCQDQWHVKDSMGATKYEINSNQMCNTNTCAPSICCPVRSFEIYDVSEGKPRQQDDVPVGKINNIFACSCKRLCLPGVDQYQITYPPNASAEDKALLLSGLMLIEYCLFEIQEENHAGDGGGGAEA